MYVKIIRGVFKMSIKSRIYDVTLVIGIELILLDLYNYNNNKNIGFGYYSI